MDYKIDSHKLMYHPRRISDWLADKPIAPIYVEMSLSGMCNHHCIFCAMDFKRKPVKLRTEEIKSAIKNMSDLGIKSIMFGGEGEPFIHEDIASIIEHTNKVGIDVAITTNGVLMKPSLLQQILPNTKWIKVSMNAGSSKIYAHIHDTHRQDFYTTIANIAAAIVIRNIYNYDCAIGIQAVVLEENVEELYSLALTAKSVGVDYLVLKPYAPLDLSGNKRNIVEIPESIVDSLRSLETSSFKIIVRENAFRTLTEHLPRGYDTCFAASFWSYIDSEGNVWACSVHMNDNKFLLGNIYTDSAAKIWLTNRIIPVNNCRVGCRMHQCNQYLHDLIYPRDHVNFI